jgi:hypothetical protein
LPPGDRDWADPFIFQKDQKWFIFFEEILYSDKIGHICVMELKKDGSFSTPEVVLKKEYHLSYPFLFEDGDDLFMIPETSGSKQIQLYKCIDFPNEWKLHKILMDNIVAVDTTIFKINNKYWLFTNIKENDGANTEDELFLFYSEKLDSNNWTQHPSNPVISDIRSARPAGNLFRHEDNLYRPSQNGSKHYGYAMKINEISIINENTYKEKIIESINPDWDKRITSTHTINKSENLVVIDARIRRRRF